MTEAQVKAEIRMDTTLEEYTTASLLAARRKGSLRWLPLVVLCSAALLLLGISSWNWIRISYISMMIPFFLCISCPLLLIFFFWKEPRAIKKQAAIHFKSYQDLMTSACLKLYADNAVTVTPHLKLTDQYALMAECIETPDLFVFIKDNERLLVLPKRCLPSDRAEDTTQFLRLVFARRRHAMKNWYFDI